MVWHDRGFCKFVADCYVCQKIKTPTSKVVGLLQPLPIPEQVWKDLSTDFSFGLSMSKGSTIILVVVNRLTKAAHFRSLPISFTAISVANLITNMVVKRHGFSLFIILNRDSIFLNKFWQTLFKMSGTTLKFSSAYHLQTDR